MKIKGLRILKFQLF